MSDPSAERRAELLAEEYLDLLQAGKEPDRAAFLSANPDLAALLEQKFRLVELLHGVAQGDSTHDTLPQRPETASAEVPVRIGRYEILGQLGRGGFSTVYQAYDPTLDRTVALKVFHANWSPGSDHPGRFHREARIAAQLWHPNIVPMHEPGEDSGRLYLDMELVPGGSLEARLKSGPLPPREAAAFTQKLAAALDYAHSLGIVHRDVKPANVLLKEVAPGEFEPQLSDFGLARRFDVDASVTGEGNIVGTLAYMSPEQAAARPVDRRTDIYSLGVVLYRMLTGQVPFPAGSSVPKQISDIAVADPARPTKLNPAVPRDLETICLKAMAKDPADRFATAADFGEELRRWLNDESLRIRPPTVLEKARRWARRNRTAAWTIAASVLLWAVVIGTASGLLVVKSRREELQAERAELEAQANALGSFKTILDRAWQRMHTPTGGRRKESVEQLRKLADHWPKLRNRPDAAQLALDARSAYMAALGVPDVQVTESERLPEEQFLMWRAAIHPDGTRAAIGTDRGPVRWVPGQPLTSFPNVDKNAQRPRIAYSPDGKLLTLAPAAGGVQLFEDADLSRPPRWWDGRPSPVLALGFEPGGRVMWACSADGHVQSFELPELKPGRSFTVAAPAKGFSAAAFDRDATALATGDENGQVIIHRLADGPAPKLPAFRTWVGGMGWSPNGRQLAIGTRDGSVHVVDPRDGLPIHRLLISVTDITGVCYSPDSQLLAAGGRGQSSLVWSAASGRRVLDIPAVPWGFSADGNRLVAGTSIQAMAFDILFPAAIRELDGHVATVQVSAWSRDNRHLVTLDDRFELRVWDVVRHSCVFRSDVPVGSFYAANGSVALSDDGQIVVFASGGEKRAVLRFYDVNSGGQIAEDELPGGYEQLACVGGRRFRLVREELSAETENSRTVAYDLEIGRPLGPARVIRTSKPGDVRRFCGHGLTSDGRYYWWIGPRIPETTRRVEVYLIGRAEPVFSRDCHHPSPFEPGGGISPDCRSLWFQTDPIRGVSRYDLVTGGEPVSQALMPVAQTADAGWIAFHAAVDAHDADRLALFRTGAAEPLLHFQLPDRGYPRSPRFSPDGRHLAWSAPGGPVFVAELPAVEKQVQEFEATVLK